MARALRCLVWAIACCGAPWHAAALDLIELHGPDGQRYFLNTAEITTIREPLSKDLAQFTQGTHCVIVMTSSKFVAVREGCDLVRNLALAAAQKPAESSRRPQ